MKKNEIPDSLIHLANRLGFDTLNEVGVYQSKTVYTLTLSKNECPLGLPNILLWDNKVATHIKGEKAIDILNEVMH